MTFYLFCRIVTLEKGTLRHKIAQQTLISEGEDPKAPDYELFTDNGSIVLWGLYLDMLEANVKEINKEERNRLKL